VARYRQLPESHIIGVRGRPCWELTALTTFPDPPGIPSRPAVYTQDSDDIAFAVTEVKDELGWPDPAVYADDQPRTQLASLVEAIAAGQGRTRSSCRRGAVPRGPIRARGRIRRPQLETGLILTHQLVWLRPSDLA
jgi:hypothetical protein